MKTLPMKIAAFSLLLSVAGCGQAFAQTTATEKADEIKELRERVTNLEAQAAGIAAAPSPEEEELTKLKLDLLLPTMLGRSFTGLGPGVSKVYFTKQPLSLGGYGEVQYFSTQSGPKLTNVARVNPILGYRFTSRLIFNSGFSFQNGGSVEGAGAARVEFAYLDMLFGKESGLRVGNVLVPFGLTNLRFEPHLFPMVNRPRSEVSIVPSTWHENGIIAFGRVGSVMLQGGVMNSLDASRYDASTWVRAGRQGGSLAKADDSAWVFRAEHEGEETTLGASFFLGHTSQGAATLGRAQLIMAALHGEVRLDRFSAKALFVDGRLTDTDKILAVTTQPVGQRAQGATVILAYDLLPRIAPIANRIVDREPPPGWRELPVFVSWEEENLHAEPPEGQVNANPALRMSTWTLGLNYKPHPQVVIKGDFAHQTRGDGQTARVVETGIGFVF